MPYSKTNSKFSQIIGANIRNLRTEQEMKACELARSLGTTRGIVSQWEKGKACPSLFSFAHLCWALDCRAEDLLEGVDMEELTN